MNFNMGSIPSYLKDEMYLTDGKSHVLIEIFNEKVITYTLKVYKSSEESVLKSENILTKVEVSSKSMFLEDILTPGIVSICFLLIVILYTIIFHKSTR